MRNLSLVPPASLSAATDSPPENLIEVYRACLDLQILATKLGVCSLSAPQAGIPWRLCVVWAAGRWQFWLNPGYEPAGDGRQRALVRFVNAEEGAHRYYLVEAFATVRGWWDEMVVESGPPSLVRNECVGPLLELQNEVENLSGRHPALRGQECRIRV